MFCRYSRKPGGKYDNIRSHFAAVLDSWDLDLCLRGNLKPLLPEVPAVEMARVKIFELSWSGDLIGDESRIC